MIKNKCNEKSSIIQVVSEFLNNMPSIIEKMVNWELKSIEDNIRKMVNTELLPIIYKNIFEQSFEIMKSNLDSKSKELWYIWTKKRTKKIRIMSWSTIEIPVLYARTSTENEEWKNLTFEHLWIIDSCTPNLMSDIVSTWLYAPSFQVWSEILATRWVNIDDNKIASLTYKVAELWLKHRWKVSFNESENFAWKKVIIWIDWGRIRTRKTKKGRKKTNGRKWFKAEWRETKSLVISIIWEDWTMEKKIKPFYDACIWTPDEFFEILALYLIQGEIWNAKNVCIVADWAKRIWNWTKKKLIELWVSSDNVVEVLDYYHAVEHLWVFTNKIKKITEKEKKKLTKKRKELLRNWEVDTLLECMKEYCRWRNAWSMKKEITYFKTHKDRINYSMFRENWLICWSWIIESMIRRTTNLRLKWNWIFWKICNAQKSLFLRSQLISWRWWVFIGNTLNLNQI